MNLSWKCILSLGTLRERIGFANGSAQPSVVERSRNPVDGYLLYRELPNRSISSFQRTFAISPDFNRGRFRNEAVFINRKSLSRTQAEIMNSRKISLAIATVVTILSGTVLPSHADRSCPLGFTSAGSMGCQKVVKVTIANICIKGRHDLLVGRDLLLRSCPF